MHKDLKEIERNLVAARAQMQDPQMKDLAMCVFKMLEILSSMLEDRERREAAGKYH